MQFILNDQIWGPQWRVLNGLRRREVASPHMGVGVLDLGRPKPVSRTEPIHLSEEHLSLALPRHLCELVHGRDNQRRHKPVDLFINDQNWQSFFRGILRSEKALPEWVSTVDERSTATLPV